MTTYDPVIVNELATIPLVVGGVFAFASVLLYGLGSRWWTSLLGGAFLGIMVAASTVAAVPMGRRVFGEWPGYEWGAFIGYSLHALAWIGLFTIILYERHRAPVATLALARRSIMTTTEPTTPAADARQRSLRTLLQGLAVDVVVAVGVAVALIVPTIDDSELLTTAAWVAIGTAVVKSVLTAAASYLTRLALPPSDAS